MKTKKVTIKRSTLGKVLIWTQLVIVSPILAIALIVSALGEIIINSWRKYSDWFISHF